MSKLSLIDPENDYYVYGWQHKGAVSTFRPNWDFDTGW